MNKYRTHKKSSPQISEEPKKHPRVSTQKLNITNIPEKKTRAWKKATASLQAHAQQPVLRKPNSMKKHLKDKNLEPPQMRRSQVQWDKKNPEQLTQKNSNRRTPKEDGADTTKRTRQTEENSKRWKGNKLRKKSHKKQQKIDERERKVSVIWPTFCWIWKQRTPTWSLRIWDGSRDAKSS